MMQAFRSILSLYRGIRHSMVCFEGEYRVSPLIWHITIRSGYKFSYSMKEYFTTGYVCSDEKYEVSCSMEKYGTK